MNSAHKLLTTVAALLVLGVPAAQAQQARPALIPHPAWDCRMPEGIPGPESGSLVFEIEMPLDLARSIGRTQYGQRAVAVGLAGAVTGPKLTADVMEGTLDYELTLANGTVEVELIMVLRASDGSYILSRSAGTGPNADDVRIVMDFEAPNASPHAWLNDGRFVARRDLDASGKTLSLRVYDVANVAVSTAGAVRIEKPAGVPAQPWDYRRRGPNERQGEQLITENVTLAPSQRVGPTKRGSRNIIPITGGVLSGKISGTVLMGGADYQNLGQQSEIDARYLWQADNGDIIVVRNGGSGGLTPTFEARVDGPHAYLNEGLYLSSPPGMGQGGVSLQFYESVSAE
jgi:hypothetical protein